MSRYRRILCRVWDDEKVRALTDDGKLLFMYHLTSPKSTPFLLYTEGPGSMADSLRWHTTRLSEAMTDAFRKGLVKYSQDGCNLVFLPNGLKQPENAPESPNAVKSWLSLMADLPKTPFFFAAVRHWLCLTEGIRHAMTLDFVKASGMAYPMPPVQEQEQDQEQEQEQEGVLGEPNPGPASMEPSYGLSPKEQDPKRTADAVAGDGDNGKGKPKVKPQKKPGAAEIRSTTPVEGLDALDRVRRMFSCLYRESELHDGVEYPGESAVDRIEAGKLLRYHKDLKDGTEWVPWLAMVFRVYLGLRETFLVSAGHPMRFVYSRIPAILGIVKQEQATA